MDTLKTFRGTSMADALNQVKRHFGRTAVILTTRTVSRRGVLGLASKPYVEITAARDVTDLPDAVGQNRLPVIPPAPQGEASGTRANRAVLTELGAVKTMIGELVQETRRTRHPRVPAELFEHYRRLIESNVASEIAEDLISSVRSRLTDAQLADPGAVRAQLAWTIAGSLPPASPIQVLGHDRPFIVALIGPTGVGKTTTIAKLAANLCLRENRRVGLITLDSYRIAAVDQLKTYARIIDVPLEVALSPEQLSNAVAAMHDRDIVFLDTAGRSQRDRRKNKELQSFLAAVKPHETHLVLSAAADQRVLEEAIGKFKDIGFNRVIFTKLDEAIGFGVLLNCLQKVGAELSYITTGQDVPDDIRVAEHHFLTELVLGASRGDKDPICPPRK
jgi:flagellar biosynthesis protein FlhF